MANESLSTLATELEEAGLLGGAAATLLTAAAFGEESPGYLTTTLTGAVWTKTIANMQARSVSLGAATLKMDGGRASFTAGFDFDDKGLTEFNFLVQVFQGATSATQFSVEFDTKRIYRASALKEGDAIIGYQRPTQANPARPLILGLPLSSAVEISIRRGPDDRLLSALKLHGPATGGVLATQGVFQLSLGDDLLVFPDLLGIGLSLKDLFLDLSETTATPISGLFSEVYDPSWKGIGAKKIGLHMPLDDTDDRWVNASLEGFLVGLDGRFSAQGTLNYSAPDTKGLLLSATGELDIRNNEVVKGAFSLGLNLDKSAKAVNAAAAGTAPTG